MSSVKDFLFGDQESTKGIRFTQADNERRWDAIGRTGDVSRQDVLDIFPRGQEALQQGYRAAIDVATRTPMAQGRVLSAAGQHAQAALLRSQDEYRRAILGLPSLMNQNGNIYGNPIGAQPLRIGMAESTRAFDPFTNSQRPLFLGSQEQDRQEMAMRRNNPGDYWELASPNKDVNLFPEQFRTPVMYQPNGRTFTGGEAPTHGGSGAAPAGGQLYNAALTGQLNFPWGQPNWTGV